MDGEDAHQPAQEEHRRHLEGVQGVPDQRLPGVREVEADEGGKEGQQGRHRHGQAGVQQGGDNHGRGGHRQHIGQVQPLVVRQGDGEEELGGGHPDQDQQGKHEQPRHGVQLSRLEQVEVEAQGAASQQRYHHRRRHLFPGQAVLHQTVAHLGATRQGRGDNEDEGNTQGHREQRGP